MTKCLEQTHFERFKGDIWVRKLRSLGDTDKLTDTNCSLTWSLRVVLCPFSSQFEDGVGLEIVYRHLLSTLQQVLYHTNTIHQSSKMVTATLKQTAKSKGK